MQIAHCGDFRRFSNRERRKIIPVDLFRELYRLLLFFITRIVTWYSENTRGRRGLLPRWFWSSLNRGDDRVASIVSFRDVHRLLFLLYFLRYSENTRGERRLLLRWFSSILNRERRKVALDDAFRGVYRLLVFLYLLWYSENSWGDVDYDCGDFGRFWIMVTRNGPWWTCFQKCFDFCYFYCASLGEMWITIAVILVDFESWWREMVLVDVFWKVY